MAAAGARETAVSREKRQADEKEIKLMDVVVIKEETREVSNAKLYGDVILFLAITN